MAPLNTFTLVSSVISPQTSTEHQQGGQGLGRHQPTCRQEACTCGARVLAWGTRVLWASNKIPSQTHLHHYYAIAWNRSSEAGKFWADINWDPSPISLSSAFHQEACSFQEPASLIVKKKRPPAYFFSFSGEEAFHPHRKRALPFTLPGTVPGHVHTS